MLLTVALCSLNEPVSFHFDADSDPAAVAREGCHGAVPSCQRLARPAVELAMHRMYGTPLAGWSHSEVCGPLPPQEPLSFVQQLHVPKSGGTAFALWLRDYSGCPVPPGAQACDEAVSLVS